MLSRILLIVAAVFVVLHGLVHVLGFIVYSLGLVTPAIVYKTTLLNGTWDVGAAGIFSYGLLWLLPIVGFVVVGIGLLLRTTWWRPVMLTVSLFSLVLTTLDWQDAYLGTLINLAIIGIVVMTSVATRRRFSF